MPSPRHLEQIAKQRVIAAGARAQSCFDAASEIIVFGSMSAGIEGPESDIDILCVGPDPCTIKDALLDLLVITPEVAKGSLWLQSELATHIATFGTPLKGKLEWRQSARIGPSTVNCKKRRVRSFLEYLPSAWLKLNEGFRVKYAVKLRRETQRLILLEQGLSVPPTKILDSFWESIARSRDEVRDRLFQMSSDRESIFTQDLLARVEAHFDANSILALPALSALYSSARVTQSSR